MIPSRKTILECPARVSNLNNIRVRWGIIPTIKDICDMWNKPHRHYHTVENHLIPMLNNIDSLLEKTRISVDMYEKLYISALFHDIIYDPKSKTNEEDSVSFLLKSVKTPSNFVEISNIIMATKTHYTYSDKEINEEMALINIFIKIDLKVLSYDFPELLKWEQQIQKEYEFVNWKTYKKERIKVLNEFLDMDNIFIYVNREGIKNLIYFINEMKPNIAIYAGSFNPFHKGHLDVVEKAEKIFDKVIIAKGKNDSKSIDVEEFVYEFEQLQKLFPNKEVITYEGLLTDLITLQEGNITLVRGLRNGYDLDAENTLMAYMKDLLPTLQVIYLPCDKKYEYISSSSIRMLRKYGSEKVKKYLP